jgi:hypothetical protein
MRHAADVLFATVLPTIALIAIVRLVIVRLGAVP